jgi:hypothetical protein
MARRVTPDAAVIGLLFRCAPFYVVWLIMPIIVYAIYGAKVVWALAYIF